MIVEGDNWGRGTLFMSNHRFPVRLWPALVEFDRAFDKTYFICDAPFSIFLTKLGLKTLCTDTSKYIHEKCSDAAKIKHTLITTLGIVTARGVSVMSGGEIVDSASNLLEMNHNVFMFPSTVTGCNSPWRSGVGRVASCVDPDKVGAGFVFIPKRMNRHTEVVLHPTFGSILPNVKNMEILNIVDQLQKQHQARFGIDRS